MWSYFDLLCNLTLLILVIFTACSYAAGLFYLAEQAEEYPTYTKQVLFYTIAILIALHFFALFLSTLSVYSLLFGLLTHLSYLQLITTFPDIPINTSSFYISLILIILNQVNWMYTVPSTSVGNFNSSSYARSFTPTSTQLLAFYLLFVWLIPLALFITASVSESALPVFNNDIEEFSNVKNLNEDSQGKGRKRRASIGKWSLTALSKMFKKGEKVAFPTAGAEDKSSTNRNINYQSNNNYSEFSSPTQPYSSTTSLLPTFPLPTSSYSFPTPPTPPSTTYSLQSQIPTLASTVYSNYSSNLSYNGVSPEQKYSSNFNPSTNNKISTSTSDTADDQSIIGSSPLSSAPVHMRQRSKFS